jgi:hypothetical protein
MADDPNDRRQTPERDNASWRENQRRDDSHERPRDQPPRAETPETELPDPRPIEINKTDRQADE